MELWAEEHIITAVDVDSAQNAEVVHEVSRESAHHLIIRCSRYGCLPFAHWQGSIAALRMCTYPMTC